MVEHATWRALGTSVHLLTDGLDLATARRSVERVLDDVDATYSRFRPDSELQMLQATACRDVRVSRLLAQAIGTGLRVARQTGGAVDPTVGRAMRAIGYDEDFSRVATRTRGLRVVLAPIPGWRAVRLDESKAPRRSRPASRSTSVPRARRSRRTSRPRPLSGGPSAAASS